MVITALAAVVVVIYHFREGLPVPQTVYLFFTAIMLVRQIVMFSLIARMIYSISLIFSPMA